MFNCPHDRKLFTCVTTISPNNLEIHFLLTGFFTRAVPWQLSWYQNSYWDPIPTLREVLDLLPLPGVFSLASLNPPSQTMLSWASLREWKKVTHENILVYYYTKKSKINHKRCPGIANGMVAPPCLPCLPFLYFSAVLVSEAAESSTWRTCALFQSSWSPVVLNHCCRFVIFENWSLLASFRAKWKN